MSEHGDLWRLVLHLAGTEYGYQEAGPRDALGSAMSSGATLEATPDGLTIKPGTCPLVEYASLRTRYLAPNKAAIIKVLKAASAWQAVPEPDWAQPARAGVMRSWYESEGRIICIAEKKAEES